MAHSNSESPIEQAAKGATKGGLEYCEDKIKELANKLRNRELAFIEDRETIDLVVTQRNTPEWKLLRQHIKNSDLRFQVEMGFALKKLENDKSKLSNLIKKILNKYGSPGLHVAELVERGIFTRYVHLLLGKVNNDQELEEKIQTILIDIDKYVLFVQSMETSEKILKKIVTKLDAFSPKALIIFSRGKKSMDITKKALQKLDKEVSNYQIETQVEPEAQQRYDFILKSDEESNL